VKDGILVPSWIEELKADNEIDKGSNVITRKDDRVRTCSKEEDKGKLVQDITGPYFLMLALAGDNDGKGSRINEDKDTS
jgi:hypothetical protein